MKKSVKEKVPNKFSRTVARPWKQAESVFIRVKKGAAAVCRSVAARVKRLDVLMCRGLSRGKLVLCNTDGGILDVALEVAIGVVVGLLILLALKNLWGVNILPPVTSKVNSMVS